MAVNAIGTVLACELAKVTDCCGVRSTEYTTKLLLETSLLVKVCALML